MTNYGQRSCVTCEDDGWIEVGEERAPQHCPHRTEPWHRPFNYTGLLDGNNGILERLGGPDA